MTVADAQCISARPASAETQSVTTSCTYQWNPGPWQLTQGQCTDTGDQTRTVTCERSDGVVAEDYQCTGPKPIETGTAVNYTGCNYDWSYGNWKSWSSTCANAATRTRTAACYRYPYGDTPSSGDVVADSSCDAADKQATTETQGVYTGCATQQNLGINTAVKSSTVTKTLTGLEIGSKYVLTLTGQNGSAFAQDTAFATITINGVSGKSPIPPTDREPAAPTPRPGPQRQQLPSSPSRMDHRRSR